MKNMIESSWLKAIEGKVNTVLWQDLSEFIEKVYHQESVNIFPLKEEIFRAFNECKFDDVKVVILGQDPYPTKGHAHGLSFSVDVAVKPFPKSLNNIFKEIESDLGLPFPENGDLTRWAKQGVLLLNSILTVEEGKTGSHSKIGWEQFTDIIISTLASQKSEIVYMLWGSKAQEKGASIDANKNLILSTVHPSPLSSYRGFFGCKHFSKANDYLVEKGKRKINW